MIKKIIDLFQRRPLLRQAVLYGIIGGFSALIDTVVFWLLTNAGMAVFSANFISVNLGMLNSFLWNYFVNFNTKDKPALRALLFFCVGYLGLGLSMLLLYIGVDLLSLHKMAVKIASIFIVAAAQFVLNKLITFRKGG